MKSVLLLFFIGISSIAFAQKGEVVTTEDGRKVLLKPNFTWEYLDATASERLAANKRDMPTSEDETSCQLPENFKEPNLNSKIQNQLKRGHATIDDIKEKVAKDNNVSVSEVILTSATELRTKGEYHFCVKGKKQVYKRLGNTIMKKGKLF
ncbi:DUF3157 family protein [Gaetbulibacter aestuarii]|uniref:DUF3157 family protein n=1 Tax=Gaetbulibacter aestuarii TaxID=1502358 RepID=A0ABW7MVJ8_9FLAO